MHVSCFWSKRKEGEKEKEGLVMQQDPSAVSRNHQRYLLPETGILLLAQHSVGEEIPRAERMDECP